jgi:glycosyltransferase involved in cell wall biosynthesis
MDALSHTCGPGAGGAGPEAGAEPLVSVILIFFNEQRFLGAAIDSVLAQTHSNWELLLCDDGSTDRSAEIARSFAECSDGRIRYLAHPGHTNHGPNATRNLGARHARGDLLAFLDGDDVWLPQKLERQVVIARDYPQAAMIYGRTLHWYGWTGDPADSRRDSLAEPAFACDRITEPPLPLVRYLKDEYAYPCMCSVMVRRWAFESVGGFDEAYAQGSEDMAFHAKIFLRYAVYASSECWDRYRIHEDSFWRRMISQGRLVADGRPHDTARRFLEWLESYMLGEGLRDRSVRRALRAALRPYRRPYLHRAHLVVRTMRDRSAGVLTRLGMGDPAR